MDERLCSHVPPVSLRTALARPGTAAGTDPAPAAALHTRCSKGRSGERRTRPAAYGAARRRRRQRRGEGRMGWDGWGRMPHRTWARDLLRRLRAVSFLSCKYYPPSWEVSWTVPFFAPAFFRNITACVPYRNSYLLSQLALTATDASLRRPRVGNVCVSSRRPLDCALSSTPHAEIRPRAVSHAGIQDSTARNKQEPWQRRG